MAKIQRTLNGHIIVCGFGTSGSQAVEELIKRGHDPREIVVLDQSDMALSRAEELGCNVLDADATRDTTLKSVHIERASAIIVSAGRDDTSILITLSARHLAPDVPISVVVRNQDNELPARVAGATTVINPVSFAGLLLATASGGPHVAEYMSDLASHEGRVKLIERPVEPEEVGRALSEIASGLGVRIYRDGRPLGFFDPEARTLLAGDLIVEIRPTGN